MNKTETKKPNLKHKERNRKGQYAALPTHGDDKNIPCKAHGKCGDHGCEE